MQINSTLYKTTKTGATQVWSVFAEEDVVRVEWGQLDGKIQRESYTATPKNIGRSNETTASGQAQLEAEAKWEKQLKKGYTETLGTSSERKLPAKIGDYKKIGHRLKYPCIASIKRNGVNALIIREGVVPNTTLTFYSRGGEVYPPIPHMIDDIHAYMDSIGVNEINAELYKHGEHLQDIQSAVKKHNTLTPYLQAYVFELPELGGMDYTSRWDTMEHAIHDLSSVETTEAVRIDNEQELHQLHTDAKTSGYEGLVVKNLDNKYQYGVRASDAMKLKDVMDEEFLILSYKTDKKGHAVFTCKCNKGDGKFEVKCKGGDERRKQILSEADNWVGQWLKVEFEMLSKAGKPLKPIGICLREMKDGEVVE